MLFRRIKYVMCLTLQNLDVTHQALIQLAEIKVFNFCMSIAKLNRFTKIMTLFAIGHIHLAPKLTLVE